MMVGEKKVEMERAEEELERRSRYLSSLIQQQRSRNRTIVNIAAAGKKWKQGRKGPPEQEVEKVRQKREEEEAVEDEVVHELPDQQQQQQQPRKEEGDHGGRGGDPHYHGAWKNVRVRASDMPAELQKRAIRCTREALDEMPRLNSKRLALMLKKEFDSSYGPAWHCIVGTSFGSYVTHSLGGFLYFSIDKVYILLFRTAVEPLEQ